MRIFNRNSEGYPDPTAGEAFSHITREENQIRRQEALSRKEREWQAQSVQRKQETMEMLKHLDETNGWTLGWTNPNRADRSKRKETLVSFFCIVNYDCYTRSFLVIVHSLIMIPCQECPLNSVPGCHSIFSLTISSASLRKASILSRSSKHFLTLSIILSSVPCKGS